MRSMTGFGRGEASEGGLTVAVELRSVNNRFLDVVLRLPREQAGAEAAVQAALRAACRRGRVEVGVRRQASSASIQVQPDLAAFRAWQSAVDALLEGRSEAERAAAVPFVLAQPGVIVASTAEIDVALEERVLLAALALALEGLSGMRREEGARLAADLSTRLDEIEQAASACAAQVADLEARLRTRVEERMRRLLGESLEPWRLAQEAALLAERSDVAEELTRLASHVAQARALLRKDEAVGRTLDFLVQELLREVNTLGSKTVDAPVAHLVVEMKAALERMKEQAANVE